MANSGGEGQHRSVNVVVDGKPARVQFGVETRSLAITFGGRKGQISCTAREILWAELSGETFRLSVVNRGTKSASLIQVEGTVAAEDTNDATTLCEEIMEAAYAGLKRNRRFCIVVNPHGGKGQARLVYLNSVEPIFKAARCVYDTTYTKYSKHASEIAKKMPLGEYDAVVILSGDGLIHEVINGFGAHDQPAQAFTIPIAPIPTGSGNGTSINLLGLQDGFDVCVAALNAIKGYPMKADVCSVKQGDTQVYSFMTQALGLMSELDVGTENLRWMGDGRFIIGFLRGLIKMKPCPVTVSIKVAEQDKDRMAAALRASSDGGSGQVNAAASSSTIDNAHDETALLGKNSTGAGEWITFEKPLLYLFAGKGPYVGRDLMQFPVSQASDGLVDVVLQELSTRGEMLKAMDGADKGSPYWLTTQHYFKAHAYRVTPTSAKGVLAVDGESYPFMPYEVEVHAGLATFLSPSGTYASDFDFGRTQKFANIKQAKRVRSDGDLPGCCR